MNVIVIEDQILFRELIVSVLRSDFDLNVLGEYDDGETGMQACLDQSPDLLVLDIKIKKLGGLTVFNRLKDRVPDMKIILVSAHFTPEIVKSSVVEACLCGVTATKCVVGRQKVEPRGLRTVVA